MQAYVNSLNNGLGYQNVPLSTNASPSEKTGKDITVSAYESINDYRASNSVSFEPGFTFTADVTSASFHASVLRPTGDALFPFNSSEPIRLTF